MRCGRVCGFSYTEPNDGPACSRQSPMTACCAACRHIKRISTQHTPGRRKTLLHTMIQGWRHANTQDCGQAFGVQPGAGLQRFACLNAHCRRTFATAQACGARLLVLLCMLFTVSAVPVDWCSVLGLGCAAVPSPPPRHTAPAASTSAHLLCPNDVHHVNCWCSDSHCVGVEVADRPGG